MDMTGQFILVPKHMQRRGKLVRRHFHSPEEMPLMMDLATQYATAREQDFLIVQVIAEVSRPEKSKTKGDNGKK